MLKQPALRAVYDREGKAGLEDMSDEDGVPFVLRVGDGVKTLLLEKAAIRAAVFSLGPRDGFSMSYGAHLGHEGGDGGVLAQFRVEESPGLSRVVLGGSGRSKGGRAPAGLTSC